MKKVAVCKDRWKVMYLEIDRKTSGMGYFKHHRADDMVAICRPMDLGKRNEFMEMGTKYKFDVQEIIEVDDDFECSGRVGDFIDRHSLSEM